MKIDRREVHLLSLRLKIMLEPYGVSLDTRMFEDMIREDNGKVEVCDIFLHGNSFLPDQ